MANSSGEIAARSLVEAGAPSSDANGHSLI
jgi:hypothetical protein